MTFFNLFYDIFSNMLVTGCTKVFAIIADPVSLSFSPVMHNAAYQKLEIDAVFIPLRAKSGVIGVKNAFDLGFSGLAVSAPFKRDAFCACTEAGPMAKALGVINTVVFTDEITGHNTDVDGIIGAFDEIDCSFEKKDAAIIGAGGAARAAVGALAKGNAGRVALVARDPEKAALTAAALESTFEITVQVFQLGTARGDKAIAESEIIINTAPTKESPPFDSVLLLPHHMVLDAVYQPGGTPLIFAAATAGACVIGGERMLLHQALRQFELHTGHKAPRQVMERALGTAMGWGEL